MAEPSESTSTPQADHLLARSSSPSAFLTRLLGGSADFELEDPTMTTHIHTFTNRHHDLYTHEALSFNLNTDLDRLLKGSGEESEM